MDPTDPFAVHSVAGRINVFSRIAKWMARYATRLGVSQFQHRRPSWTNSKLGVSTDDRSAHYSTAAVCRRRVAPQSNGATFADFPGRSSGHSYPHEFRWSAGMGNWSRRECATSDVAFQALPMEDATRKVWAALLRTELIGIADVHSEHGALYIDRAGQCYQGSGIHDAFSLVKARLSTKRSSACCSVDVLARCFVRIKRPSDGTAMRSVQTTQGSTSGSELRSRSRGILGPSIPTFLHCLGQSRPSSRWAGPKRSCEAHDGTGTILTA